MRRRTVLDVPKQTVISAIICAIALLAGCAPQIRQDHDYSLQREAIAGTHKPVPKPLNINTGQQSQPLSTTNAPQQQYGSGVFINPAAAKGKPAGVANEGGTITFNFDNQPVQAAVKAILGDVLHANYSIAPDVKGSVTFSTSQPVTQQQVLPILQMLLSWTGNALVSRGGGYLVVPVDQAAAGNLVPGLGAVPPGAGYAARLFPLHYVSAPAMQKLLKPFANSSAFLLVDPLRNLLVMGGTPDELANYQRIIHTFDVDWLRGMSVDVIPIQEGRASEIARELRALLEQVSGGEMGGGVRLMPLVQSNSIVVITSQPAYLVDIKRLLSTVENGARDESGIYVYNVLNVQARSLAIALDTLFAGGGAASGTPGAGAVAPSYSPLESSTLGGLEAQQGFGRFSPIASAGYAPGLAGSHGEGPGALAVSQDNASSAQTGTKGGIRIVADNANNQLLIRAKPGQWEELLPVIKRLDQKPLQVQIETRVLEVDLTGAFQFGVQYYLGGLIGTQPGSPPNTNESYHRHQGAVGLGGVNYNATSDALFYSFAGNKLQFALRAMESSGDAKVLSTPSAVVLNNHEATFKVGNKIPVVQNYYVSGLGTGSSAGSTNVGQVQYIDTGVLLNVVPRVSPDGLVYLNVQQIASNPTTKDAYGNYTIANRALSTEVAVRSGQTVLLGGLIQQDDTNTDSGVPFLNSIPLLGRLFGTTDRTKTRTELIVLITPRVIRNPQDSRRLTDEYESRFDSLKPILPQRHVDLPHRRRLDARQ